MKKRIMTLVAALALAATVVAPVNAAASVPSKDLETINKTSDEAVGDASVKDTATANNNTSSISNNTAGVYAKAYKTTDGVVVDAKIGSAAVVSKTGLTNNDAKNLLTAKQKNDTIKDVIIPNIEAASGKIDDVKVSGEATQAATTTTVANFVSTNSSTVRVGTLGGDGKDQIHENGIQPIVKEMTDIYLKNVYGQGEGNKADLTNYVGTQYFEVKGAQAGDMTFKLPDEMSAGFDNYAYVIHYTGNASDSDGVTAQYVKVSAAGKVTAHFNSYSPIAIITTNCGSAQQLVNTWNHSIGSDEIGGAAATTTTTATTTPVATPVETTATTATTDANAAAGKTAASPKTGDNAYALYLILAVAAVAGTTLVATKKTR